MRNSKMTCLGPGKAAIFQFKSDQAQSLPYNSGAKTVHI